MGHIHTVAGQSATPEFQNTHKRALGLFVARKIAREPQEGQAVTFVKGAGVRSAPVRVGGHGGGMRAVAAATLA
jgi:hypothetical protein